VSAPDLTALQQGDAEAWDEAFRWLWPVAFSAAQLKLQPFLPSEIEDVAMEALEEMVERARQVKQVEELKPLTASIAHHRAVSRLREHFAKKRGKGKTESLDFLQSEGAADYPDGTSPGPVLALEHKELAERLGETLSELKPPQGAILNDFFMNGLPYEEISLKHGVAIGSVGVYLKRGLETLRRICDRREET
jgi:RNA polymerase sigma factor (sigma-70 family)